VSLPVAILAGGLATRLRPLTERIPKALIEVGGKPFAAHQIELLRENDIREVVWLVGYQADQIEATLGNGTQWNMRFTYVRDGDVLLGTGGAVRHALSYLGPAFFVMYGDSYLECDFQAVERAFRESGKAALMTMYRNEGRYGANNVELVNGRIVKYDKHAVTADMQYIDWGLGVFRSTVFASYPSGEPLDLARVYQDLLAAGDLEGCEMANRFYEVGSPQGITDLDRYLKTRSG
jgi:N-acetyl-alpha-D-muramate 1-phosphate uridylyltransferase